MERVRRGYQDTTIGQVHYHHAGAGEPLLLLHRGAATSEVYVQLMGLLASDFSVVAVDNPGFGMSDHPPRPYTIPEFVQVVLEVLDGLQIDTTHVLGHHTGCARLVSWQPPLPSGSDGSSFQGLPGSMSRKRDGASL